jgi:hypothetical protein
MSKQLGTHFGDELRAAGLSEGIAFMASGEIIGRDALSASQRQQLDALIAAHNPNAVPPVAKVWTPLEFLELFTPEERKALRTLAKTDDMIEDWLDLLRASTSVVSDDPRTVAGMAYLVAAGVLTQARVDEALS